MECTQEGGCFGTLEIIVIKRTFKLISLAVHDSNYVIREYQEGDLIKLIIYSLSILMYHLIIDYATSRNVRFKTLTTEKTKLKHKS